MRWRVEKGGLLGWTTSPVVGGSEWRLCGLFVTRYCLTYSSATGHKVPLMRGYRKVKYLTGQTEPREGSVRPHGNKYLCT